MTSKAGLRYALSAVHSGESDAVRALELLAERHVDEHEVHHVATDLGGWSRGHIERVSALAAARGLRVDPEPKRPGRLRQAVDKLASETDRRPPAIALLEDLRSAYLAAAEASTAWEMLAQRAAATQDTDALALVSDCHPQTLRQLRWANTMLKTLAPQALTSM
jgi:hypothetical protein